MKHYKSPTGDLHAYEADGSQDMLIPANFVFVTDQEAEEIRVAKQAAFNDSLSYKERRAMEYPDFQDYLDGIVKGDQRQIQAYIDQCNAVKLAYPKP